MKESLGCLLSTIRDIEGIPKPGGILGFNPIVLFSEMRPVEKKESYYEKYMVGWVDKKNNALDPIDQKDTIFCDVCGVQCTGEIPYQNHLKGKPHQKMLKALRQKEKEGKNIKNEFGLKLSDKAGVSFHV